MIQLAIILKSTLLNLGFSLCVHHAFYFKWGYHASFGVAVYLLRK